MANRSVTDTAGRTWTCALDLDGPPRAEPARGRDVVLSCATPSVSKPVRVTVGWQWESMAAPGLARLINLASPAPRN
jgi:hypothetical protein